MYNAITREKRAPRTLISCNAIGMEPKDRLRLAREAAGYATRADAARSLPSININTLNSNENGYRDISRQMAETYAKAFNVSAGWILYGEDFGQASTQTEDPDQNRVNIPPRNSGGRTRELNFEVYMQAREKAREIEASLTNGGVVSYETFKKLLLDTYNDMIIRTESTDKKENGKGAPVTE